MSSNTVVKTQACTLKLEQCVKICCCPLIYMSETVERKGNFVPL